MSFAVILLCLAFVLSAALIAWWTLEPINRVAGVLQFSTRFMLSDVLGLMMLLQAPLAVAGRAIGSGRSSDNGPYWLMLGLATLLALILWMASVSVVSRAGITRVWRRLCVIVVLVPGTLGLIIAWPLAIAVGYTWWSQHRVPLGVLLASILTAVALVGITCLFRALAFWSLIGSPGEEILAGLTGRRPTPGASR